MQAFIWDQRFVTGLESVDSQHQHLVDMVNQVGDLVLAGQADEARLKPVFLRLADYARFHFADEERLMDAVGMDPRHAGPHRQHHADFIRQVLSMWQNRANITDPVATLHDFLAAWLTVHILGEDQVMGRIIGRIRAGEAPAGAYDAEAAARDNSVTALLDALHSLYHLLSVQNRDLAAANERLEEQVQARTRELLQAEKMASVGRLAAGVAHEINNPVGFVQSNLGTLKGYADQLLALIDRYEQAGDDRAAIEQARQAADLDFLRADLAELLAESRGGLDRVAHIVRHLKDFSHVDEAGLQDSDLNAGLENSLQVAWHALEDRIEVVRDYGRLPAVRCVPAQINQVFFNLISNAALAMEDRGTLTLKSRAEGGWVEVSISDTGKGMATETLQHIFDPFYTTRPVGKGAGLGLSEAYDIVDKHGGRIEVESEPGRGSTFRIRLPAGPTTEAGA
jgi:hemerythrin-like metal-binding protein